jgi:hypothetical protein
VLIFKILTLIELVYLGEAKMRGLAPHLSMKPKASSKKDFDLNDLKDFDFDLSDIILMN